MSHARIEAAADWLQSDDSAYEQDREAAMRAAREMLRVSDEEIGRLRSLLQEVVDDMMFNTAPNAGTMDKIREDLSRAP